MKIIALVSRSLCLLASLTLLGRSLAAENSTIEVTDCVVRFAEEVHVPSVESGRVAAVNVKLNEPIDNNAIIARLDDRTLKIRHRASTLRLDHARRTAMDDVELRYAETALAEAEAEQSFFLLFYV